MTADRLSINGFNMIRYGHIENENKLFALKAGKVRGHPQLKIIVLTAIILIGLTPLAARLEQNVEKPDTLYLGSHFFLNLTSDVPLSKAIVPDTLSSFAVVKQENIKQKGKSAGLKLTVAALDTGTHTFPSLIVRTAQSPTDTLRTLPFTLTINETRAPEDSLLRDIAPTVKLKGELPWWAYYVIGAILLSGIVLLAAIYLLRLKKKRTVKQGQTEEVKDERQNWQKALDALNALKQEDLPAKGEFLVFHFRLSEIMKQYLEDEYGFPAKEMTSREIRHYFQRQKTLQAADYREIVQWLESCDLVKFAKHETTVEECNERLEWFVQWLQQKQSAEEQAHIEEQVNA